MTNAAVVARFPSVDSDGGARIRARRKALGMQAGRLSAMAEVSREHLSAVENGHKTPTDEWIRRVELAMDRYARETGQEESDVAEVVTEPSAEPLRFTFHDVFGIGEIIVEGPVDRPDEIVASIAKLLAEIRGKAQ